MDRLKGKKLLILGGKPIGSVEIVSKAKELGIYTIVTDYLPINESPAKSIADEVWNISTADIETLVLKMKASKVDGVYTGVHEFNIKQMIILCDILGLPCYCNLEQWNNLENKKKFKEKCINYNIPVAKDYEVNLCSINNLKEIDFPVIIKPVDGSGSRGFSICNDIDELITAHERAKTFSETENVIIEELMDYRYSVIINYSIIRGKVHYCGMSDKRSKRICEDGAPIMSFQFYPSNQEAKYLATLNQNTIKMIESYNLESGVLWIEAFCKNDNFIFNEVGYRFGGSLTYYPVKYYYGINQLELQLEYALTGNNNYNNKLQFTRSHMQDTYCILPTHVRPGKIHRIKGIRNLLEKEYLQAFVPVHVVGDCIQNWGSAQQVFAYIHYVARSHEEAKLIQQDIMNTIIVEDLEGNNLLFNLVDENVF